MAPAGWVGIFNDKGEQAFVANISQRPVPVAPRTKVTTAVESPSALPKGEYTVQTALNYHGEQTLEETSETKKVEQDIIPPTPPPRPTGPQIEFTPSQGTPVWVWGLLGLGAP